MEYDMRIVGRPNAYPLASWALYRHEGNGGRKGEGDCAVEGSF
jgi:hypothetical protein